MAVEARLAVLLGRSTKRSRPGSAICSRVSDSPPGCPRAAGGALEHIQHDKKVFGDAPRWILPCGIGRAAVSAVGSQLRVAWRNAPGALRGLRRRDSA